MPMTLGPAARCHEDPVSSPPSRLAGLARPGRGGKASWTSALILTLALSRYVAEASRRHWCCPRNRRPMVQKPHSTDVFPADSARR